MPKDPNAKRYKTQTAFRLNDEIKEQLEAFIASHRLPPTRTAVLEAALREYIGKYQSEASRVVASP